MAVHCKGRASSNSQSCHSVGTFRKQYNYCKWSYLWGKGHWYFGYLAIFIETI